MKVGISGLSRSGKSTIFNSLKTKTTPEISPSKQKSHIFSAKVKDSRLPELGAIFPDKKIIYPEISFVDIPNIKRQDNNEGPDFQVLREQEAIVEIIRFFEREEVLHTEGSINPQSDILLFERLLIEEDLALIIERIQRIEGELKKGKKDNQKEFELLNRLKEELENKKALRNIELTLDEEKLIRGFKLLSQKPIARVVNLGEEKKQADIEKLKNELNQAGFSVIEFYGRLELEMEALEDEKLKGDFLKDLGIELSGAEVFIKRIYDNIGLITFFTIGEDQVRGWSIIKGTKAPEAGGKIHSDMESGFIKAEVIEYYKFKDAPSSHSAKTKGFLRQEDKDYIVNDGDIINFKFSV